MTFPDPSKRVIAVLGAALLLGAGGAAVAQTQTDDRAAARQAFLDDVAGRLGVTSDELEQAFKDARLAQIDAALADGKITEEEAQRMKDGIESGKGPFFGGPGFRGGPGFDGPHHRWFGPGGGAFQHEPPAFFGAAADYLGLSDAELRNALMEGESLADLAKEQEKSVDGLEDAIVESFSKQLDEAVAAGRITEAQKTEILDKFSEHVPDLVQGLRMHHEFRGGKPGSDDAPPPEPSGA